MGDEDARHLLARTGFGASPGELTAFAGLSRAAAVDRLLAESRPQAQTPPPAWVGRAPFPPKDQMAQDDAKAAYRDQVRDETIELREWWYREMWSTHSPLTERMTLFWHNHFVSGMQKVKSPPLMYQQNALLRREALGNFGRLLHEVARDPAMLVYLDGVRNRKEEPNENFAREVMELFTLGEGHYGEQDIREAARALTGMSLERDTGRYRFRPALHDDGNKRILGRYGNFDGDGFIDILLSRPELAEFISRKLWREFVSPDPDADEIKRLAAVFRQSGYEIKPLLRALLLSDAFWSPRHRGVLVKSPVELTVGTLRTFGIEPPAWRPLLAVDRAMGQSLFDPPNVKGWPGYTDWINSQTLLQRKQLLARVFRVAVDRPTMAGAANERFGKAVMRLGNEHGEEFSLDHWLADAGGQGRATVLLLPLQPDAVATGESADAVRQLVMNPLYQLK
jgi:uncharacterized protein (DUF1800 family)